MTYAQVRLITGGTYTTGASADWLTQFATATLKSAVPTISGEASVPEITYGVCVSYSFFSINSFSQSVYVEASAGAPIQVYVNPDPDTPVPATELAAAGTATISVQGGHNVIHFVRSVGPIFVCPSGPLFDPLGVTGQWTSLYPQGSDPFTGGGGGIGMAPPTEGGGPGIA